MPDAWLEVRCGRATARVVEGEPAPRIDVHAGDALEVRVGGLPGSARVRIGEDLPPVRLGSDGVGSWFDPTWLQAVAGEVLVCVEDGGHTLLSIELGVSPTKLTQASLLALLEELEALASGLTLDLGGRAGRVTASTPEAALQALDGAVRSLGAAVAWVRRRPIGRARERVFAAPAARPRSSADDVRWLARHPVARMRAEASGQGVAVVRQRDLDLDVPENRGALAVMDRLDAIAAELGAAVDAERHRLMEARSAREAFRTDEGTLWDLQDAPRLRSLDRRALRLRALSQELRSARGRTGLPETLRRGTLRRNAAVEAHPGYWRLYGIQQEVAGLGAVAAPPAFAPLRNLDALYELWAALQVARAVARLGGRSVGEVIRLDAAGWFAELPRGELLRVALPRLADDAELVLHYEPEIPFHGDAPWVKLHPGRPWRPDLLLEVRRAGFPVELHALDAKHRVDGRRPDGLPREALERVWMDYGEGIGWRATGLPAVSSVWVLYPGPTPGVFPTGPAMLRQDWPPDRLRGGGIALVPGRPEGVERLVELLELLCRLRA